MEQIGSAQQLLCVKHPQSLDELIMDVFKAQSQVLKDHNLNAVPTPNGHAHSSFFLYDSFFLGSFSFLKLRSLELGWILQL